MPHEPAQRFKPSKALAEQPPCRVADLGVRFAAAVGQWNALDGNPKSTKAIELTNDLAMSALSDAAVFEEATSALGALFQLCIVSTIADRLSDMAFEAEGHKRAARADMIRADSALWSIRKFIEAQFGVSAVAVGGEYMMSECASPAGKLRDAVESAGQVPTSTHDANQRQLACQIKQTVEYFRAATASSEPVLQAAE